MFSSVGVMFYFGFWSDRRLVFEVFFGGFWWFCVGILNGRCYGVYWWFIFVVVFRLLLHIVFLGLCVTRFFTGSFFFLMW